MSEAPIISRYLRLRKQVLEASDSGLTFEGLIDALLVLYEECNADKIKKSLPQVEDFLEKFQSKVHNYNKLRINIGDFEVKRIIGRGNFADVKLAKERSSGNVYALKVMRKGGENVSAFYEEERDIMARSASPWLTKLDYAFQDASCLYLAMEFHAGGDLLSLMHRTGASMEETAVRFYTAEVALGIHDLHKMGFVHRDIKPENILIDRTGHLKLADFGNAARLSTSGSITKAMPVGTPEYIAPEVLQCLQNKQESHGAECDYWSLGILAYEMFYGDTPFSDLDGSVINTYSNIMSHKLKVEFPKEKAASANLKSIVEGLLLPAARRLGHKQILRHPFFGDLDWNNMQNMAPPHVPQVKSLDDASNFEFIEEEPPGPNIESLRQRKEFKNLPYIGFTFTSDKGKAHALECKENSSLVEDLKAKAAELEKLKLKYFQLEQQMYNVTQQHEMSQREFEETERLTAQLALAEQEIAQLKTNIKNMEVVLEVEKQERSAAEHKTLQLLQDVRKKWYVAEEERTEKIRSELREEKERSEKLEAELCTSTRETKSLRSELESVTSVKIQLKNKLKDYKQRLENVANLEDQRSQTMSQLEAENQRLKQAMQQTKEALDQSKTVQGKVDTLSQIIKQRDQIVAEKDAEIRIKMQEIEAFASKHKQDKKSIQELEDRLKKVQSDLRDARKEAESTRHQQEHSMDEQNSTMLQMKSELAEAIVEISTLRDELQSAKDRELALQTQQRTVTESAEAAAKAVDREHKKAVAALERVARDKEQEYKAKIQELEKVFDKLQARIEELQKKRHEEAANRSSREVLELEARLERSEAHLEKRRRKEADLKAEVAALREEKDKLIFDLGKIEKKVSEVEEEKKVLEQTALDKTSVEEHNALLQQNLKLEQELKEAKLDLRIEKRELEKKAGLLTFVREREAKNKERIAEMETRIADLENSLENLRGEKEALGKEKEEGDKALETAVKLREELSKIKNEKAELMMESRKLKTDISALEKHIDSLKESSASHEEERDKWRSVEANNETLKNLCEELDKQVMEYEAMNEKLQEKIEKIEAEKRDLVSQVDTGQEEIRKAKIAANEEKSAKIFVEKKVKDLTRRMEDMDKEMAQERELQNKNLTEYKELCQKLSSTLEEMSVDNLKKEQFGILNEKQKNHLEIENKQLKAELTERITQLHSHKESNFTLTQGIEEAIGKIEIKNRQIDELQLKIEADRRVMSEQVTRHEATIAQQSKLIDFLQQKVEDLEGRPKTLADKLFGSHHHNKENRPENPHLVVGYSEVQQQLRDEKAKNRKLQDQLARVRTEVVALKTGTGSRESATLPRTMLSHIEEKSSVVFHNIPHRLNHAPSKKTTKCPVCQDTIGFMIACQICKDCSIAVHSSCTSSLPNTCGLNPQLLSALNNRDGMSTPHRARSNSEGGKNKNRPLPNPPNQPLKEGPAQVMVRGEWTDCYLVLTASNVLDIYEDSSKATRLDQVALTSPSCRVSVQPSVSYNEAYYLNPSDRPYAFKLTVSIAGMPEKALYLMCQNFARKGEWVNKLEEVIKSVPTNLMVPPECSQEQAKQLIAAMPDNEILSMCHVGNSILIGTERGLVVRTLEDEVGGLKFLTGISTPVHRLSYIPSIQLVVLATGDEKGSSGQLVTVNARSVESGTPLQPEPVPDMTRCHIFATHTSAKGNVFLCAADKHMVTIFEWSPKKGEFVFRNKFSTDKHTGCIFFTENSVLIGTTKFYEIDLKNFSAEEFLDTSDNVTRKLMSSPEFEGSEPRAVLPVPHAKEPEYLLCFTRHVLFTDGYGQQTREPMRFQRLPMEHRLLGRVLATSFSDRIQLLSLDLESGSRAADKIEIFCSMPHLLAQDKSKLFYATHGDAAYNLVALDMKKIRLKD